MAMRGKGGGEADEEEEEDIVILAVLDMTLDLLESSTLLLNSSRVFVGTIGRPEIYRTWLCSPT
jgi:hypothetical protein